MKEIELYDILTMNNGKEYSVLRIMELETNTYYLIAQIDKNENPIIDTIKIVEIINDTIKEINDQKLLDELKELFISSLDAEV